MAQSGANGTCPKVVSYMCLYLGSKEFRRKLAENLQDHVENRSLLAVLHSFLT